MAKRADSRTDKRKLGDLGENIACEFLVKQGFEIVERNYLRRWGEIDIVARKGDVYHFIEVKSVSCVTLTPLKSASRTNVSHETYNDT